MSSDNSSLSFYFQLSLEGIIHHTSFKEVSGITMEMETEEITEGGINEFKHRVPTTSKFTNLILKRGIASKNSDLINWCSSILGGGLEIAIITKNIEVSLLDKKGDPLKSWNFKNAWPIKWEVSELSSMNNEVLIEILEFSYSYFEVLSVVNKPPTSLFD